MTIAAKKYLTNFKTDLHTHFKQRQKTFIGFWLQDNDFDLDIVSVFRLQCDINGWKSKMLLGSNDLRLMRFVQDQKAILWGGSTPGEISEKYLKSNPGPVLHYLFHILEYYRMRKNDPLCPRGFSLAPLCQIKMHHVTIDSTVLWGLARNVLDRHPQWEHVKQLIGGVPQAKFASEKHRDARRILWGIFFMFDGLRRRRRFNYQVDTDGVACTVHFVVTKKRKALQAKRRRHAFRRQTAPDTHQRRVISIDPGRVNLVSAYDTPTGSPHDGTYHTLSRRQYYRQSGIDRAKRRVYLWSIPLRGIYTSLSKGSMRSTDEGRRYHYRQVIIRNYDRLWTSHTNIKRRKEHMACYAGKRSVLDKFFSRLIRSGPTPQIAYGAATFSPSGKGELSAPVKSVFSACCRFSSPTLVNEHLSTKVHSACTKRMHPVTKIRGLYWCPTCNKLVNRDRNADLNILRIFLSLPRRPSDLAFGQARIVKRPRRILPLKTKC
jgi:hypothetical protein